MKHLKNILYIIFCIIVMPVQLFVVYVDAINEITEKTVDEMCTQVRKALWVKKGGEE